MIDYSDYPPRRRIRTLPSDPNNHQLSSGHDWTAFDNFFKNSRPPVRPSIDPKAAAAYQQNVAGFRDQQQHAANALESASGVFPSFSTALTGAARVVRGISAEDAVERPKPTLPEIGSYRFTPGVGHEVLLDSAGGPRWAQTTVPHSVAEAQYFGPGFAALTPSQKADAYRRLVNPRPRGHELDAPHYVRDPRTGQTMINPLSQPFDTPHGRWTGTAIVGGGPQPGGRNVVDAHGEVVGRDVSGPYGSGFSQFSPQEIALNQLRRRDAELRRTGSSNTPPPDFRLLPPATRNALILGAANNDPRVHSLYPTTSRNGGPPPISQVVPSPEEVAASERRLMEYFSHGIGPLHSSLPGSPLDPFVPLPRKPALTATSVPPKR
jgi:hypothetical protein